MKFSFIGTGFIMPRHADAIYAIGGKIVDVVNTGHGENAWKAMVRNTSADCIVIMTPNDLHVEMARAAVEAGKTALCEKPLGIKSEEIKQLIGKPVYTVLQLRHHPLVKKLKEGIDKNKFYEIELDISVYRDPQYYASWKGQTARSGGVLFNLGIHYFDLLQNLFGQPEKISLASLSDKTGIGALEGENYKCRFKISTDEKRDSQRRVFKINGVDYNFSSKDNLSYENLHQFVYKDLLDGNGVTPEEAIKSVKLVEAICQSQKVD